MINGRTEKAKSEQKEKIIRKFKEKMFILDEPDSKYREETNNEVLRLKFMYK